MALFDGMTLKEVRASERRQHEKNKESVRTHRPTVYSVEDDGKYMSVRWTTKKGERVSANFKLIGWAQAPAAELKKFHKAQSHPPRLWIGPRAPKSPVVPGLGSGRLESPQVAKNPTG